MKKNPLLELTEPDATRPPDRDRRSADALPEGRRGNPSDVDAKVAATVRRARAPRRGGWIA